MKPPLTKRRLNKLDPCLGGIIEGTPYTLNNHVREEKLQENLNSEELLTEDYPRDLDRHTPISRRVSSPHL